MLDPIEGAKVATWHLLVAYTPDKKDAWAQFIVKSGAQVFTLKKVLLTDKKATVEMSYSITLPANFQVGVRFLETAVGNKLEVYGYGIVLE